MVIDDDFVVKLFGRRCDVGFGVKKAVKSVVERREFLQVLVDVCLWINDGLGNAVEA